MDVSRSDYFLTAIELTLSGSSTVHIYTQTVHRIQITEHTKQYKSWEMRAVPRLCELYTGICLTAEENARKNLSHGSRKVLRYPGGSSRSTHLHTNSTQNTTVSQNTGNGTYICVKSSTGLS
jgi:hypothetical protein